jgi:hypothetical protein
MSISSFIRTGLIAAAVSVVAIPSLAAAKPLEREHYSGMFTDTFTDTECGDPITIDYTNTYSGVFMLKEGRHGDPTPYFFDNYSGVETLTNVANDKTLTLIHQGIWKDQRIEHVAGTTYRFTALEAGRPVVAIGPDGNKVVFDRGRIFHTFLVDTLGDADLSNDIWLDDVGAEVAGPHPIFFEEVAFCDGLDLIR